MKDFWGGPTPETVLDYEQRDSVEVIRSSGQLLLNIINDILDFSKLEANQVVLERVEFDLEALCIAILDQPKQASDVLVLGQVIRHLTEQ